MFFSSSGPGGGIKNTCCLLLVSLKWVQSFFTKTDYTKLTTKLGNKQAATLLTNVFPHGKLFNRYDEGIHAGGY
jgi:hypothetical protein